MTVALGNQHAKRMGRFVLSSVACSVLQYVTTLSRERHEFRKKKIYIYSPNFVFFYIPYNFFPKYFSLQRRIQRFIITNIYWTSCKVPVILVRFHWNLNFSTHYRKIITYQISWKSIQWALKFSMRNDRNDKARRDFRAFTKAPKKRVSGLK